MNINKSLRRSSHKNIIKEYESKSIELKTRFCTCIIGNQIYGNIL